MPNYHFRCPDCGAEREEFLRIADMESNSPKCCEKTMKVVLYPALVVGVQVDAHYKCMATGKKITSRRQRRYVMESRGLVDAGDYSSNMGKEIKRRQRDKELAAELYKDVPREVFKEFNKINKETLEQRIPK